MADRAEMFALSTFHSLSPPGCRPPQDISLEEFDDEDLSEITDDCGIGLNYDSDQYEKDYLALERCEQSQPICTFQDDFQEFEMIDDNEEEEEDEANQLEVILPSLYPVPLLIPEKAKKHRPTTLNLIAKGTQDSLNNNSSCNPANPLLCTTSQEVLFHPTSSTSSSHAEQLSPSHPCLLDGPCLEIQSSPAKTLCKPPLFDAEDNSQKLQGPPTAEQAGEDYNMNMVSVISCSQPPFVGKALAESFDAAKSPIIGLEFQPLSTSPQRSLATHSYCVRFQRDVLNSRIKEKSIGSSVSCTGSKTGQDSSIVLTESGNSLLSGDKQTNSYRDAESAGQHSLEAHTTPTQGIREPQSSRGEGACGDPAANIQGLPLTSSDTTSPDPGLKADLTYHNLKAFKGHTEDLRSLGSNSDAEGEIEVAFTCTRNHLASNMISSISETDLDLSSSSSNSSSHLTNSIEEASSPGSEAELEVYEDSQSLMGLKDNLMLDSSKSDVLKFLSDESLADVKIEEFYEAPSASTGSPGSLELEINPDHSLGNLHCSFYLADGSKLLPKRDDNDEANSEYDSVSDSELEPDLSEDSDSPWLLNNLVNKMITEGSYPLKCADECFPSAHSIADTISPASDLEPEIPSETLNVAQPCSQQSIELVDMETLRCSLESAEEKKPTEIQPALLQKLPDGHSGSYLFLRNTTNDTIIPVFSGQSLSSCCKDMPAQSLPSRNCPCKDEPVPVLENWVVEDDLDSGILKDNDMIDDIQLECSESLDISTSKINHCFNLACSSEEDETSCLGSLKGSTLSEELPPPPPALVLDDSLAYDSIKYTLVVDENTQLELVSLKRCTSVLSNDIELLQAYEATDLGDASSDFGEGLTAPIGHSTSSNDSSPEPDIHFSKKFLNVFVNSTSRSSSTESFGLFSCMVNGKEREQTHRAVFRFIPRHEDELELDVDDPILVELEEDDYWYQGYNMRTGECGIFPAFYAHEAMGQANDITGLKRNPSWVEHFNVQFLGSVEVPYHQGNGILCAAMQKIATTRKLTAHLRPPAICDLEVSLQGIKLILSVNEYSQDDEFECCSHFFQMKNISFCGCHPSNCCYFGFITKHPVLSRFACHVFVSQESMRHVAECVGHAFLEYYQEHLDFACPTEDIYLE